MELRLETPDHELNVINLQNRNITPAQLQSAVLQLTDVAGYSILGSLQSHTRSGMTAQSIEAWVAESSPTRFAMAVGSRTRGHVLRWLDRGRGEVRPKHQTKDGRPGYLKFVTKQGNLVFTRYSRPTQGINLMDAALAKVAAESDRIVAPALQR